MSSFFDPLPQPFQLLHEILSEEVLDRVYIAIDAMELTDTFRKERAVKVLATSCEMNFGRDAPLISTLTMSREGRSFALGTVNGTAVLNSVEGVDSCASMPARAFAERTPVAAIHAGSWTDTLSLAVVAVRGVPVPALVAPSAARASSDALEGDDDGAPAPAAEEVEQSAADVDAALAAAIIARRSVVVMRGSIGHRGVNALTAIACIETKEAPSVVRLSDDSKFLVLYSTDVRALRLYRVPVPVAPVEESVDVERQIFAEPESTPEAEAEAEAEGGEDGDAAATTVLSDAATLPVLAALLSIATPAAFPNATPWPLFTAVQGSARKLLLRWSVTSLASGGAIVPRQYAQYSLPPPLSLGDAASAEGQGGGAAAAEDTADAAAAAAATAASTTLPTWASDAEWRVPAPITASALDDARRTSDLLCIGMGRALGGAANACGAVVWSLRTGTSVACLRKHRTPVSSVAFVGGDEHGANPTRLVVAAEDATIHLYNLQTLRAVGAPPLLACIQGVVGAPGIVSIAPFASVPLFTTVDAKKRLRVYYAGRDVSVQIPEAGENEATVLGGTSESEKVLALSCAGANLIVAVSSKSSSTSSPSKSIKSTAEAVAGSRRLLIFRSWDIACTEVPAIEDMLNAASTGASRG